jgi:hypothetical protein
MSSFFGNKKGAMMLAGKLLELANLVGLSQSDIARHFGLTRSQVNLWAKNKRLVPKRYREALVTLVTEAASRCLHQANPKPGVLGEKYWNAMGVPPGPQPLRERLRTTIDMRLDEWMAENLERHGLGPTASVSGVLEALEAYKTMSPEEMRKPANAQRLQALGAYLQEYATMLNRIGPVQELVEETNDVDNDHSHNQSHEPGNAGAANSGDYQAHAEALADQQS